MRNSSHTDEQGVAYQPQGTLSQSTAENEAKYVPCPSPLLFGRIFTDLVAHDHSFPSLLAAR